MHMICHSMPIPASTKLTEVLYILCHKKDYLIPFRRLSLLAPWGVCPCFPSPLPLGDVASKGNTHICDMGAWAMDIFSNLHLGVPRITFRRCTPLLQKRGGWSSPSTSFPTPRVSDLFEIFIRHRSVQNNTITVCTGQFTKRENSTGQLSLAILPWCTPRSVSATLQLITSG